MQYETARSWNVMLQYHSPSLCLTKGASDRGFVVSMGVGNI